MSSNTENTVAVSVNEKLNRASVQEFLEVEIERHGLLEYINWAKITIGLSRKLRLRLENKYKSFTIVKSGDDNKLVALKTRMRSLYHTDKETLAAAHEVAKDRKRKNKDKDDVPRKVPVDHLMGPGTEDCERQLADYEIENKNISAILMKKRKKKLGQQKNLKCIHDLLVLNFIFTRTFFELRVKKVPKHIADKIFEVNVPTTTTEAVTFMKECESLVSKNCLVRFRRLFNRKKLELEQQKDDEANPEGEAAVDAKSSGEIETEVDMASMILDNWTRKDAFWDPSDRNESTYLKDYVEPIVDAVFGRLKMSAPRDDFFQLPDIYDQEDLRPDMQYVEDGIPVVLMEAKKPLVDDYLELKDERKLLCMMKISLDMMIERSIKNPAVVGLLVQRGRIEVIIMSLEHEALYFPKTLGIVDVPEGKESLGNITAGLGVLSAAKSIAVRTRDFMKGRIWPG